MMVLIGNLTAILLVAGLIWVCAREILKGVKSGGCAGCSGGCAGCGGSCAKCGRCAHQSGAGPDGGGFT